MSGTLPGARHCVRHQSNTSHYASDNCEQCCLLAALRDIETWCANAEKSVGIEPYGLSVARAAIAKAEGRS